MTQSITTETSKKVKGDKCEQKFKEWLEMHNILYMYIDQEFDTYSSGFPNKYKRPDFMVLIPNFGFILVDVKFRQKSDIFSIDIKEVDEYINLIEQFGVHVWFAVSNEDSDFRTWYWISANEELDKKDLKVGVPDGLYSIPFDKCRQIGWDEGLEKLIENKK